MTKTWIQKIQNAELILSRNDSSMGQLIQAYGPCELKPHNDYYQQIVKSIVGQQLSVKAASTIYSRFTALFNETVPSPEQIQGTSAETLRQIGFSYAKASYIHDLSARIIDGRLDLEHIASLPNDDVIAQLVAVKGIGEWSAHMFMMFSLGRLDILATGDLGIRKAMMQLYELPSLPDPTKMHEVALARGWAPYQSIACWYLWRSLDNTPS